MKFEKDYYIGYNANTFLSLARLQQPIAAAAADMDLLDAAAFFNFLTNQ